MQPEGKVRYETIWDLLASKHELCQTQERTHGRHRAPRKPVRRLSS